MGLDPLWVTDPHHRLTPNQQLTALGNGVLPLQALACQTWIEGTFTRHYAGSPVDPLPPTGEPLVWPIHNIFQFDDQGRLLEEWVQYDNRSLLRQLGVSAGA